jgi:hypothetical protein
MKHAMIAAAVLLMTMPAAFAQTAPGGSAAPRQANFAERKAAESQYTQDRIAALNKADGCIKAAATDRDLGACKRTEAADLRAARTKMARAHAKMRPEGMPPRGERAPAQRQQSQPQRPQN